MFNTYQQQETGLTDKQGTPIREGDLVKFHFSADYGYSDEPHEDYTTMVDVVEWYQGEWYFCCTQFGMVIGARAWRHAPHCTVIGNIYETAKP